MQKIQTTKHQKEMPESINYDSNGKSIIKGKRIVFNRSGYLLFGTLLDVLKNKWRICRPGVGDKKWWGLVFEMTVMDDDGKISHLKNPNSFVIITE